MKKIVLLFTIIILAQSFVSAQSRIVRKGDEAFNREYYRIALNYYIKASEKRNTDKEVYAKIAQTYFLLHNYEKSLNYYKKLSEKDLNAQNLLQYGKLLQMDEKYDAASKVFGQAKSKGIGEIADYLINACEFALKHQEASMQNAINITNIGINGPSLGVTYYKDGIVYAANVDKKVDDMGNKLLDMHYSSYNNGRIGSPELFSPNLSSRESIEGAITFTPDQNTAYFAATKRLKTGKQISYIYKTESKNGSWERPKAMPFNSNRYSCTHPSLSPDGNMLFFSSDIDGGMGGYDLFVLFKQGNSWTKPVPLKSINTPGDEMFPFMTKDDKLYFASDGHAGYGGLDIFYSEYIADQWKNPVNIAKPINSARNDFALALDPKNPKSGFISSNRKGNGTIDYIYSIVLEEIDFLLDDNQKKARRNNIAANKQNNESAYDQRYKQLLTQYGVNRVSELDQSDRIRFYSELYSREEYYDETLKDKLRDFGVNSIPELSEEQKQELYLDLAGMSNLNVETSHTNSDRNEEGVIYKVQFESSRKPLDHLPVFEGQYVFRYFYKGLYRYTIGEFNDVESADQLKEKVRKMGYGDAFVVAFKNNKRLENFIIYKK